MAHELELKAVVHDPATLRRRLQEAGGVVVREGLMRDRRYDRDGELAAREEVLRVRHYQLAHDRGSEGRLTWKGPTLGDARGYRVREEHEVRIAGDADAADALLRALGFASSHEIDRWVEYWAIAGATVRLEWYPRMDVLCEVEGAPQAIEAAIEATGIPRADFTADAIAAFVMRYETRNGPAAVSLRQLGDARPSWEAR